MLLSDQLIKTIVLEKLFYHNVWQSFGLPAKTCLFKYNALWNSQIPAPFGEFLSNLSSSGIHESGFKWSTLLCMIFVVTKQQCAAQNSPFFPLLIRKSLAPSFCLCNVFLNFPETATAMLRQNLKNWKLYSKEGNTATYGIKICPVFFFSPVNPNICYFSFLSLHLMSPELVSSLISKVWVRIFLSAAD